MEETSPLHTTFEIILPLCLPHLPASDLSCSVGRVNRQWREHSFSNPLWCELVIRHFGKDKKQEGEESWRDTFYRLSLLALVQRLRSCLALTSLRGYYEPPPEGLPYAYRKVTDKIGAMENLRRLRRYPEPIILDFLKSINYSYLLEYMLVALQVCHEYDYVEREWMERNKVANIDKELFDALDHLVSIDPNGCQAFNNMSLIQQMIKGSSWCPVFTKRAVQLQTTVREKQQQASQRELLRGLKKWPSTKLPEDVLIKAYRQRSSGMTLNLAKKLARGGCGQLIHFYYSGNIGYQEALIEYINLLRTMVNVLSKAKRRATFERMFSSDCGGCVAIQFFCVAALTGDFASVFELFKALLNDPSGALLPDERGGEDSPSRT